MKHSTASQPRGAVLIIALVMVILLAMMTFAFASRIGSAEQRMESDIAASYALELAESANDWNVQRIFRNFDLQNDANKLGDNAMSPVGDSSITPTTMLSNTLRATTTGAVAVYDFVNPTTPGNFQACWTSTDGWMRWGPGEVKMSARLLDSNTTTRQTLVELKAWARYQDSMVGRTIERQVQRVVRYGILGDNQIYDFAYFANNYGWMYGTNIFIHGNMGSNGNLGFQGGPTVNGMLYASLNPTFGTAGVVLSGGGFTMPASQNLVAYRAGPAGMATTDRMVLPPNPAYSEDTNNNNALNTGEDVNGNALMDRIDYSLGYKGVQEVLTGQKPLDIPYLGDLQYFKNLANTYARPARPDIGDPGGVGGIVKQLKAPGLDPAVEANYNIIINQTGSDAVYGNDSTENGRIATWQPTSSGTAIAVDTIALTNKLDSANQERNGNLALIGTPDQPIVISGPVVITNDLVIRGTIQGQGTFYVGRNTHVVGDITYKNAPDWRDPSNTNSSTNVNNPNFHATTEANKDKDLVGFAVKGSTILGQYHRTDDAWNTCKSTYFKTGFQNATLQSYQVDPTDASIGYVTGTNSAGKPYFHGDYTVDEVVSGSTVKRYADVASWDAPVATTNPNRKYLESSFPNDYIQRMSTAGPSTTADTRTFLGPGHASNSATVNSVRRAEVLSGIYYTNHLFGGRVGSSTNGVKIYGTMVARDEGVVFSNKCQFVYDPRVSDREPSSHVVINIPMGTQFQTIAWEETTPGQ